MNTIRKNPSESRKTAAPAVVLIVDSIWNPPGVRMMPKAIQKPPYEESAVAPKVFPTAISLRECSISLYHIKQIVMSLGPEKSNTFNVPHAGEELHQTPIAESQSNNNVRHRDTPCPHIDESKNERRQGETAETQGCRIGNLPVLDLLVGTRLELTTEGGQTILHGGDMSEGTVSEASGGFGGFMLILGHLTVHAVALFVVETVRSVIGVWFDGHLGGCSGGRSWQSKSVG